VFPDKRLDEGRATIVPWWANYGVLIAVWMGLVFWPSGRLVAQDQRALPLVEPASQAADSPRQELNPAVAATRQPTTRSADYVLGSEDVLNIGVFDVPELSNLVVRIANDGSITLPLIGRVQAAGLTPTQLRTELETDWGKSYLRNPQVTVFLQEFHARPVSVIGAVEKPGLYPLTAPRTLVEMLSLAGGLAKRSTAAAGRFVYVTRKGGFDNLPSVQGLRQVAPDKIEIDLRRLLYSHEDALNVEIKPLDIISVSKADIIYVGGEGVRKAGAFVLEDRDNVTVLQALAMAEGLTPNAAKSDARIIRTDPDGSRTMIPVNLKKVLKGRAPDLALTANDILFVPNSAQRALLKGGATTVVSTLSWLLVYGRI
jgi:polysaccharide export outer membrane protein